VTEKTRFFFILKIKNYDDFYSLFKNKNKSIKQQKQDIKLHKTKKNYFFFSQYLFFVFETSHYQLHICIIKGNEGK
jgi:hypothetical protein